MVGNDPACLLFLPQSCFHRMHFLEGSPERLWDGVLQLNRSTSLFGWCISVQPSLLFHITQVGIWLSLGIAKWAASLNSESSGKDTLSKTVSSEVHPLHLSCLFFHPFKDGFLWNSEKEILLFGSEYTACILFSKEHGLYPTVLVSAVSYSSPSQ